MYKKIEKIIRIFDEYSFRIYLLLCIVSLVIISVSFTINDEWKELFYPYPEEQYQEIELAADRIIDSHNFDTNYDFVINNYDSESNDLEMELSYDKATIEIDIERFGESNQEVEIKRSAKNQKEQDFFGVLDIVFLIILGGVILLIAIAILLLMASIVCGIIDLIRFIIRKIKERK